MRVNEFYCVKCRKIVKIGADDICLTYLKNKKIGKVPALRSECRKCDTNLTKFVKHASAKKLEEKYGKC